MMWILEMAFLIGVVAGLRAFTAPAAVSWGAHLRYLPLPRTHLEWMSSAWTVGILTLAALVELITDKLPGTPSRTVPLQFLTRIATGILAGAVITSDRGGAVYGVVLGGLGAVVGTLGGAFFRKQLVRLTGGRDWPIAALEDCVAVAGGILIVRRFG